MSLLGFVEDGEAFSVRLFLIFPLNQTARRVTLIWQTVVVTMETTSTRPCAPIAQAGFLGVLELKAQIELRHSGMSLSTRAFGRKCRLHQSRFGRCWMIVGSKFNF